MAVLFHQNIRDVVLFAGIFDSGVWVSSYRRRFAITVWGGVQPEPAAVLANWTVAYGSTYLAHWTNVDLDFINPNTEGNPAGYIQLFSSPTVAAANSGTATWAIMWPTNPTAIGFASAIPSQKFIVIPASSIFSNDGVVRFIDPVLNMGTSYAINDFLLQSLGGGSA